MSNGFFCCLKIYWYQTVIILKFENSSVSKNSFVVTIKERK